MNTRHTLALLLALLAFLLTVQPDRAANYRLQLLEGENILLDRARQRGSSAGAVVTEQTPERVVFSQSKLVVSAERHGPGWNALWSGQCPAGIYGATFSAEIGGERLLLPGRNA